jgi:hypothetical protein
MCCSKGVQASLSSVQLAGAISHNCHLLVAHHSAEFRGEVALFHRMFREAVHDMKRLCEQERKISQRSITENNLKIARLHDEIVDLRERIMHLNSQNFQLVQNVTRYRGYYIESGYRLTQLTQTLESAGIEPPACNNAQFPPDASSPVPCSDGCLSESDNDDPDGGFEVEDDHRRGLSGGSPWKRKRAL